MKLSRAQAHELRHSGFIALKNHDPEISTERVAADIGHAYEASQMSAVHRLKPSNESAARGYSYSGIFGKSSFPLHSDLAHWQSPPRYLLLRCVIPNSLVNTHLVHFDTINAAISKSAIRRALFKPRRRQNGRLALLRYCEKKGDLYRYRWDSVFIKPDNAPALEVVEAVEEHEQKKSYVSHSLSSAEDMLLIDNWSIAHGRSEVPSADCNRVVERIYLSEIHN